MLWNARKIIKFTASWQSATNSISLQCDILIFHIILLVGNVVHQNFLNGDQFHTRAFLHYDEQPCRLARLYGKLRMSRRSEIELVACCRDAVNLKIALTFHSMTSSIESLERLERTHELLTAFSVEVVPGTLQTE